MNHEPDQTPRSSGYMRCTRVLEETRAERERLAVERAEAARVADEAYVAKAAQRQDDWEIRRLRRAQRRDRAA